MLLPSNLASAGLALLGLAMMAIGAAGVALSAAKAPTRDRSVSRHSPLVGSGVCLVLGVVILGLHFVWEWEIWNSR
jgi:hypothetical protein